MKIVPLASIATPAMSEDAASNSSPPGLAARNVTDSHHSGSALSPSYFETTTVGWSTTRPTTTTCWPGPMPIPRLTTLPETHGSDECCGTA
jgi:hypothetical protein